MMRFRFFAPTDERETGAHLALLRSIDEFWRTVQGARPTLIRGADDAAASETLARAIARVSPDLLVELDALPNSDLLLTVAPRDDALGPLADGVVERAPPLTDITVARHRPKQPSSLAFADVQRRTGIDLSRAEARAGFARGHLIEMLVYSWQFGSAVDERALDSANMVVRRLLGDERFEDWIGSVDVLPIARPSSLRILASSKTEEPERFPLTDLAEAVERAVTGLRASLAAEPYHAFCERAEWSLLELEPKTADDCRAQDDLVSCATMLPEMMKCYLQEAPFSSCRFSNHGERFVYVKIDMIDVDTKERLDRRVDLEETLNFALVPGRVGCVVAAGMGVRYVYVVLALENLEAGLQITRRSLQRARVSRRAWILFCDSAWAKEWIGVYDESPTPP